MPTFFVQVNTTGREYWRVNAESRQEAAENWFYDGDMVNSEVWDYEVVDIDEEDD